MSTDGALSVDLTEVRAKLADLRKEKKKKKAEMSLITTEISQLKVIVAWYSWVSEVVAELGPGWKILEDASEVEVYDDNEGSTITGEVTFCPATDDEDIAEVVVSLYEGIGHALVFWSYPRHGDAWLFCETAEGLVEMIKKMAAEAQDAAKESR